MVPVRPDRLIEFFADIWCPFSYAGLTLVADELRTRHQHHVGLWVRSWPLEWGNGRRLDPRIVCEHSESLRDLVSLSLLTSCDCSKFPATTVPCLALVAQAYKSAPAIGESLSFTIRRALCEEGRNVPDPEVLAEIARMFGLTPPGPDDYATVVADWKEGRARGVQGSPHFFCGPVNVFCPSLNISVERGGARKWISPDPGGLRSFLDACLI